MAGYNNGVGVGSNYGISPYPAFTPRYYQYQPYEFQYVTVNGIEGANAFQFPPGITKMILWDAEKDSFYVKMLDEMGRPKVVAWKDFTDHVESNDTVSDNSKSNVASNPIDFSVYPTKKDLEEMLEKFDTSRYLTKSDFEKALSQLVVGEKGKVVKSNEFAS